jgi:uncharacterized protein
MERTHGGLLVAALVIGLPANFYLARFMSYHTGDYWQLKTNGLYQTIAYTLGVVPLALAYTGIFILLFNNRSGKKLLSVFAPVGKMAFSNIFCKQSSALSFFWVRDLGTLER